MRDLTAEERRKIQDITDLVAQNWNRLKNEKLNPAHSLTFSGDVKFSEPETDTANDTDLLPELAQERAETALNDIKRLVVAEDVKKTLTPYLDRRNKAIKQGKANKLSAAKELLKNRFGIG